VGVLIKNDEGSLLREAGGGGKKGGNKKEPEWDLTKLDVFSGDIGQGECMGRGEPHLELNTSIRLLTILEVLRRGVNNRLYYVSVGVEAVDREQGEKKRMSLRRTGMF